MLGKRLKDEEVLQLLEEYQIDDVVYAFDRLREGTDDEYWAESKDAGFALRFNQAQILETVFCYSSAIDGFSTADVNLVGAPIFGSIQDAEKAADLDGIQHSSGHADVPLLGLKTSWVKLERHEACVHYEFRDGQLALVTLSQPTT
jgi:hypothetical protein